MKELSDKQFDELLRQKAESFDYGFDETAWDKMERKLRRRDRVIFIRNSSVVIIVLILCGGAYLLFDKNEIAKGKKELAKESKAIKAEAKPPVLIVEHKHAEPVPEQKGSEPKRSGSKTISTAKASRVPRGNDLIHEEATSTPAFVSHEHAIAPPDSSVAITDAPILIKPSAITAIPALHNESRTVAEVPLDTTPGAEQQTARTTKRLAFSVTAMAGPEFSSIKSFSGSKGTLNAGVLLNVTMLNKITLSSGLKYGSKSYAASAYNYQLQNPARADKIEGIDASCNILEIPVQLSYALLNVNNKQVRVSSGLSSYLMLKEEYNFRYTPQSGYKDYLLVKNNANQHYFSVLSLSASYQIKPKSSNFQWSIEPYVKLPLGGVGEGNIQLKSTGISLNLTYDIKKNTK